MGVEVRVGDPGTFDFDGAFGALLAYPGSSGEIPTIGPQWRQPTRPERWLQ